MKSTEFRLPDLGEGIHEAEVLDVKVKEGDQVVEDQPIFEVETDKAVVEIPSPVAGVVEKIYVKVADIIKVGDVMITFVDSAIVSAAGRQPIVSQSEPTPASTQQPHGATTATTATTAPDRSPGCPVPATPAIRKLARELRIDLNLIAGSGPSGRVLKEDLVSFGHAPAQATSVKQQAPYNGQWQRDPDVHGGTTEPIRVEPITAQPVELPDFARYGPIERIPLRSLRRKIAVNMTQSWTHIPRVSSFDEADITLLESLRQKHETSILKNGGKLTLTVFALKAVAAALKLFGQFNSSLDVATGEIVLKRYYNIGLAVATSRGLIVPVIRNVDTKGVSELASELNVIAQKTRAGKIDLETLQGGTFTITNLGPIGGTGMVPMVNFPESAIIGMARSVQKPVVRNGNIEIRWILPLAISFDHRIADGAEAAMFLRHVASLLEDPLQLLVEV